jgi:hypothetical protein
MHPGQCWYESTAIVPINVGEIREQWVPRRLPATRFGASVERDTAVTTVITAANPLNPPRSPRCMHRFGAHLPITVMATKPSTAPEGIECPFGIPSANRREIACAAKEF